MYFLVLPLEQILIADLLNLIANEIHSHLIYPRRKDDVWGKNCEHNHQSEIRNYIQPNY